MFKICVCKGQKLACKRWVWDEQFWQSPYGSEVSISNPNWSVLARPQEGWNNCPRLSGYLQTKLLIPFHCATKLSIKVWPGTPNTTKKVMGMICLKRQSSLLSFAGETPSRIHRRSAISSTPCPCVRIDHSEGSHLGSEKIWERPHIWRVTQNSLLSLFLRLRSGMQISTGPARPPGWKCWPVTWPITINHRSMRSTRLSAKSTTHRTIVAVILQLYQRSRQQPITVLRWRTAHACSHHGYVSWVTFNWRPSDTYYRSDPYKYSLLNF